MSRPVSPPVALLLVRPSDFFHVQSIIRAVSGCLCVSPCLPHPLFALPLCPPTAQMISAFSSYPVDFCGHAYPTSLCPHLSHTHTHTHTHAHAHTLSTHICVSIVLLVLQFSPSFICLMYPPGWCTPIYIYIYIYIYTVYVCVGVCKEKKSIITDITNYFPPPTTHLCHMTSSYWSLWAVH